MSQELILAHILESIGAINQRMSAMETFIYNNGMNDDESDNTVSKFTYPIKAPTVDESNIANTNQLRYIKNSMYKVKIAKPYNDTTHPLLLDVEMTRDELDEFISKNPGTNYGEFLVSIKPSYEEYL